MSKYYIGMDHLFSIEIKDLNRKENIFDKMLELRKSITSREDSFYIDFFPFAIKAGTIYDSKQVTRFRDIYYLSSTPAVRMGFYNKKGESNLELFGIKLWDPTGIIKGVFDIDFSYKTITYLPQSKPMLKMKGYDKLALIGAVCFITMPFKQMMLQLISQAKCFQIIEDENQLGNKMSRQVTKEEMFAIINSDTNLTETNRKHIQK